MTAKAGEFSFPDKSPKLIVKRIDTNKSDYMDLMLIGDESEDMVRRYVDAGDLYIGFAEGIAVSCIVTLVIDEMSIEVKNLAVAPNCRRRGVGRRMLSHVEQLYRGCKIYIGTGETPSTLRFYQSLGYRYSHRIPDFFTDNYHNPIVEEGVMLKDMIYLCKNS